MPEFFEPTVQTINTDGLPSKAKLRNSIQKAISRKKGKRSATVLPDGQVKNLIGFVNVRRHEPAGICKDAKTGETYLTGDTTPVQVIGAVRSKRKGAWAHGKRR